jgi:hypothetical protein
MILQLQITGQNCEDIASIISTELQKRNISTELTAQKTKIKYSGQLQNWDQAGQILKIILAPGILTILSGILLKLKPTIKLKIGEHSIELSGYLNKKERNSLIQSFISNVEEIENNKKNVNGFVEILGK